MRTIEIIDKYKDALFYLFVISIMYILFNADKLKKE